MRTEKFTYEDQPRMLGLLTQLVIGRGQFSVSPYPQDFLNAARTGWVVSWPEPRAEQQPEPEKQIA